jgi:protein-S-isoprenylcysteine O-methyltransferase Ste14
VKTISENPDKRSGGQAVPHVRTKFSFRNRGLLGVLLLAPVAIAVLFSKPLMAESSPGGLILNAAGWCFFLLYAGVRIWATLYVGGHKDRDLQTEGPYSICRNPLYFGSLCFALSLACFLKSAPFAITILAAFFVYLKFVVKSEEHFLEMRFQQSYRNYCGRTPRFWPRWSAFQTPPTVNVDLKRLYKEIIRLSRATLLPLLLQIVMQQRTQDWWPHWFNFF